MLISVAYVTLYERKVMGASNDVEDKCSWNHWYVTTICRWLKLFVKEILFPIKSNKFLFLLAPVIFLGRINELVINTLNINAIVQM